MGCMVVEEQEVIVGRRWCDRGGGWVSEYWLGWGGRVNGTDSGRSHTSSTHLKSRRL